MTLKRTSARSGKVGVSFYLGLYRTVKQYTLYYINLIIWLINNTNVFMLCQEIINKKITGLKLTEGVREKPLLKIASSSGPPGSHSNIIIISNYLFDISLLKWGRVLG